MINLFYLFLILRNTSRWPCLLTGKASNSLVLPRSNNSGYKVDQFLFGAFSLIPPIGCTYRLPVKTSGIFIRIAVTCKEKHKMTWNECIKKRNVHWNEKEEWRNLIGQNCCCGEMIWCANSLFIFSKSGPFLFYLYSLTWYSLYIDYCGIRSVEPPRLPSERRTCLWRREYVHVTRRLHAVYYKIETGPLFVAEKIFWRSF